MTIVAFMRPRALWPLYERALRQAAGLGEVDPNSKPGYFDKIYEHADVTVVGGASAPRTRIRCRAVVQFE